MASRSRKAKRRTLREPKPRSPDATRRNKGAPARSYAATRGLRQNAPLVATLIDPVGTVAVERVAKSFGMSKVQLAETVGLKGQALYKPSRVRAPKTQSRVKEMLEIISLISSRTPNSRLRRPHCGSPGEIRKGRGRPQLPGSLGDGRLRLRFRGTCYQAHDPQGSGRHPGAQFCAHSNSGGSGSRLVALQRRPAASGQGLRPERPASEKSAFLGLDRVHQCKF